MPETTSGGTLVVRDARLPDGRRTDVHIRDGRVAALGSPSPAETDAETEHDVLDARGRLLLPAMVDAHLHPDKTLWGLPWRPHTGGATLRDLMENDLRVRTELGAPVHEQVRRLLAQAAARGTRAARCHVDVAPEYGLDNVEGVLQAAGCLQDVIDVQLVAFPQLGLLSRPGTATLLDAAARQGAAVGGLDPIGVDGDLHGQLDLVFATAERHGRSVDVHLHDLGEDGLRTVRAVAERTAALSMGGRVNLSHAFVLGELSADELASAADTLASSGVSVVTCALGADPVVPIAELVERGVTVGLGSDGVRDPWSPFGTADMIDRAHLAAYRLDYLTDERLALALHAGANLSARLIGLPTVDLRVGDPADLILVEAEHEAQVVVDRPSPRTVLHAGRVVTPDGTTTSGPHTTSGPRPTSAPHP